MTVIHKNLQPISFLPYLGQEESDPIYEEEPEDEEEEEEIEPLGEDEEE